MRAASEERDLVLRTSTTAFLFADEDKSGALDFEEVLTLVQRMQTIDEQDATEDALQMFKAAGIEREGVMTYQQFVSLLTVCDESSALFQGLLQFASGVVQAGVMANLVSGVGSTTRQAQLSSHILDDGSNAWRESVDAAFQLSDENGDGVVNRSELITAVAKYPLISQLLRLPTDLAQDDERDRYVADLYKLIDADRSDAIDLGEWMRFFCRERDAVARAKLWDLDDEECAAITGFIFDCDGTLYQPSGLIPGVEDTLSYLDECGHPYVLLSNTGAKPANAVENKLASLGLSRSDCEPCINGMGLTAAEAQLDFMLSGHLPPGSRLLVLAPDEECVSLLRERDPDLYNSWDVRCAMSVDTAKEWSAHAQKRLEWEGQAKSGPRPASDPAADHAGAPPKVAVVFFTDGPLSDANNWSYELFESITILVNFGAEFIYTAEDPSHPSIDERYPGRTFPEPGPGMFVAMVKASMPAHFTDRTFCSGKGGNVGRTFLIDRAIGLLKQQGHSGARDQIMIVGDRFDTDVRAGVLSGIRSCLLETGAHTIDMADRFPTDIPSFTCNSIADLAPSQILGKGQGAPTSEDPTKKCCCSEEPEA